MEPANTNPAQDPADKGNSDPNSSQKFPQSSGIPPAPSDPGFSSTQGSGMASFGNTAAYGAFPAFNQMFPIGANWQQMPNTSQNQGSYPEPQGIQQNQTYNIPEASMKLPATPPPLNVNPPSVGTPPVGSPAMGTPVGSPSVGSPAMGTPVVGTFSVGAPSAGTPAMGTPSVGSPAMGTPSVGSPAMGTPSVGIPAM
ncbi:MAG: hypothetical protein V1904_12300, partial [Bacteroidota bacterium]